MTLCEIERGDSPLIVDVPHAGTHIPLDLAARLTPAARSLPDTDWHVDKLFAFARRLGVTLLVATHSRYVVDLNRDPSGKALYPGADNTELCPTRTFAGEPIYAKDDAPDFAEVAGRCAEYFAPYHALLAAEIERVRSRHGYAILLDGHSIMSRVPRFFAGRLPDLNLGTADGASCVPAVQKCAELVLTRASGFSSAVNGRFKGGYITRHYGAPARGVHALQLETAQACYMDEAPPYRWDPVRAANLVGLLQRLLGGARGGASRALTMQRIFVALHRIEAYLLVDRLAHAGIKAHVFNEHASSIVGEVPPDVAQPQVWLDDDADRASADAVLLAYQEERNRAGSTVCAKCSEENPATFELCWKCGWSL